MNFTGTTAAPFALPLSPPRRQEPSSPMPPSAPASQPAKPVASTEAAMFVPSEPPAVPGTYSAPNFGSFVPANDDRVSPLATTALHDARAVYGMVANFTAS